jgi:hypothetical protein
VSVPAELVCLTSPEQPIELNDLREKLARLWINAFINEGLLKPLTNFRSQAVTLDGCAGFQHGPQFIV